MNKEIDYLFLQQQENPSRIPELVFPLRISDNQIPQGNFNKNLVVIDSIGGEYIIRRENPQGRAMELPLVEAEYKGVGFLGHSQNGFRMRTPQQQHQLAVLLGENGIRATRVIHSNEDTQVICYEKNATSLADLWKNGDPRALVATGLTLIKLAESHNKGFILGDRWGPNELLTANGEIMFVDFDIEIFGPEAKEFEMASMLYFNSYFAQQRSSVEDLKGLAETYKELIASSLFAKLYSKSLLLDYVTRYFSYFANQGKYRWHDQNKASQFLQSLI